MTERQADQAFVERQREDYLRRAAVFLPAVTAARLPDGGLQVTYHRTGVVITSYPESYPEETL